MPKFLGTLSLVAPFTLGAETNGEQKEFTIEIEHGLISVTVKAPTASALTPRLVSIARIEASEIVSGLLGALSFASGLPYGSVFDEVAFGAETRDLELFNPHLAEIATAITVDDNVVALELIMHDYQLIQIFGDLNLALTRVQYQPIACGRVLDGIRNYLAPESAEKGRQKAGFEKISGLLNFSYDYGRFITEAAIKPRHREWRDFADGEVGEVIRRTWTITNRLLEYLRRGRAPLSAPEFPLL